MFWLSFALYPWDAFLESYWNLPKRVPEDPWNRIVESRSWAILVHPGPFSNLSFPNAKALQQALHFGVAPWSQKFVSPAKTHCILLSLPSSSVFFVRLILILCCRCDRTRTQKKKTESVLTFFACFVYLSTVPGDSFPEHQQISEAEELRGVPWNSVVFRLLCGFIYIYIYNSVSENPVSPAIRTPSERVTPC